MNGKLRKIDLEAEKQYENRKAVGESPRVAQSKFYWATKIPTDAHNQLTFSEISGKRVLEVGCASGSDALAYSEFASSYVGVDISDEAISNCRKLGIDDAEFYCTDGHKLPVEDQSVDCVIVNSLLHHMDLVTAFSEIRRVLKIGGVLIFREPLGTNPLFQFYRFLTPSARTVDERPFTVTDLRLMASFFDLQKVQWFGFTNIASAFFRSARLRGFLTSIDKILSNTPLRFMYWQFSGIAVVKK